MPMTIKRDTDKYKEHLTSAIDKAEQAISNITYSNYPEINEGTITLIDRAIKLLKRARDNHIIFKPIEKTSHNIHYIPTPKIIKKTFRVDVYYTDKHIYPFILDIDAINEEDAKNKAISIVRNRLRESGIEFNGTLSTGSADII